MSFNLPSQQRYASKNIGEPASARNTVVKFKVGINKRSTTPGQIGNLKPGTS